jgi:predicted DNA-binding protein (UPF0251 family)
MKHDKKARWLIGPVGPIQRETGDGEMRLVSTAPPAPPRPIVAPDHDADETESAGIETDTPDDPRNEIRMALFCNRCGATIPPRQWRSGKVQCADCRGKRGALTPTERAQKKLTPRERVEIAAHIKAQVAAEVAAERATFAVWLERVRQTQQIAILRAYQAIRTPEEHAALAEMVENQARRHEALLAAREIELTAVEEASPVGEMPWPTLLRKRSRPHINLWKPPTKKDVRFTKEVAARVKGRKDARQRAKSWTVRPIAATVTERQKAALYLVEVDLLSLSEGAVRLGISKRRFQELVEKARKIS